MAPTMTDQYATHPAERRYSNHRGDYRCGRCETHTINWRNVNCDDAYAALIEAERQEDAIRAIMDVTDGRCATCGALLANSPNATITPHYIGRVAAWPEPATDRRVVFSHHFCLVKAVKARRDEIGK